MAKEKIASGSVVLSANADGVGSGLQKAEGLLQGWSRRTRSLLKSAFTGFAGGIGGGTVVAGIQGAVRSLHTLSDELGEVSRAGAAASAFGLTPEQFTGIAGVAASVGEQQREFIESLVTLGKVAAEGAAGTGQVATQWFQSLNLNAVEFKQLRLDEQFFKVFESIKKLEDPAARVRALMVAFGEDGGKYLLPLLSKTPDELREMASSFAVSAEQVEKATEANQAWIRASQGMKQAWRELAVALAPTIEMLATKTKELIEGVNDARNALNQLPSGAGGAGGGGPRKFLGDTGSGSLLGEFVDALPSAREIGPSIVTAFKSQVDAWKEVGRDIDNAIGDLVGDRRTSLRLFSDSHKAPHPDDTGTGQFLNKLNEVKPPPPVPTGIVSGWVNWAKQAEHAKDQAEKLNTLLGPDFGIGLLTTAIPGAQGFAKSLQSMFAPGATLNPFRNGFANEIKRLEPKFAEALEAGSEEAYSLTLRNNFPLGSEAENPQKEANQKLDTIKDELIDIRNQFISFADKVGIG